MPQKSAGILLYRIQHHKAEVFLVHPGGPFWAKKDEGAWSIPKGEFNDNEDPLRAAKREMKEETGVSLKGRFSELLPAQQKSGKIIYAWAIEGDADPANIKSNDFEIEWPPRSGKMKKFPEVDKAGWFDLPTAKKKIIPGQVSLLLQLEEKLSS